MIGALQNMFFTSWDLHDNQGLFGGELQARDEKMIWVPTW